MYRDRRNFRQFPPAAGCIHCGDLRISPLCFGRSQVANRESESSPGFIDRVFEIDNPVSATGFVKATFGFFPVAVTGARNRRIPKPTGVGQSAECRNPAERA